MHKPIKALLDQPSVYLCQPKPRSLYKSTLFILLLPWMMAAKLFCQKPSELATVPATQPSASAPDPPIAPVPEKKEMPDEVISGNTLYPPSAPPPYAPSAPPPYAPSAPPEDLNDSNTLPKDPLPSYEDLEAMFDPKVSEQKAQQQDKDYAKAQHALDQPIKKNTTKKEAKEQAKLWWSNAQICRAECIGGWILGGGHEKYILSKKKDEAYWKTFNDNHWMLKYFGGVRMQEWKRRQKVRAEGRLKKSIEDAYSCLENMKLCLDDAKRKGSTKDYDKLNIKRLECEASIDNIQRVMAESLQQPSLVQETKGAPQPSGYNINSKPSKK